MGARIFRPRLLALLAGAAVALLSAMPARAFDPGAGVTRESGPFDLFKFGFSAYKKGDKDDAVEAYRYAAEKGHSGARWALANMYAYGDWVEENDYEAFKIYDQIARQGVEPGSADLGYFVNALMALAGYYRRGIPDSPIAPDLVQARQLYFHAASAFGVSDAQFELARLMMDGEGGDDDVHQAKKWLNRAREAGHAGATALLGHQLFKEGHVVRGLAYMTSGLARAGDQEKIWIRTLQEQAFSLADENDRRTAIAMAENLLAQQQ
jgi:TPR repeat protein